MMKRPALSIRNIRLAAVIAVTASLVYATLVVSDLSTRSAYAAPPPIQVTTFNDEYDTTPNKTCSLREAVQAVNTGSNFGGCSHPSVMTTHGIDLDAGSYILSIPAGSDSYGNTDGDLDLLDSIIIRGEGADQTSIIASASLNDRIFYVDLSSGSEVFIIQGVTVQDGDTNGGGGGMACYMPFAGSAVTLIDVAIQGCEAGYGGGGLYIPWGGSVTLENVTISGNEAGTSGGGIYYNDQYGTDKLELTNVTIYSNTATVSGGGIYLSNVNNGLGVTATNVTLAKNSVTTGSGGNLYNYNSIVALQNTLVAYGTAGGTDQNCAGDPGPNITSLGHNLDGDGTCGLSGTGDLSGIDPLLDELADNGGSTRTAALLAGSPAINAGSGCPETDQRGVTRIFCDIGAYGYDAYEPTLSLPLVLKNE
jgi:CSLREA domain-containing protein